MMKRILLLTAFINILNYSYCQVKSVDELDSKYLDWFNLDHRKSGMLGAGVDKAYQYLQTNQKTSTPVIVAVIDSGIDIHHDDLKGKIWTNEDEIPDNGIDDDNNGYTDDIHGWNFIGNNKGENIYYENLEYTRIVRENKQSNPNLKTAQKLYKNELAIYTQEKENISKFITAYNKAKSTLQLKTGVVVNSPSDLASIKSKDPEVVKAKNFLQRKYSVGFTEKFLEKLMKSNNEYLEYYLNIDFEGRSLIGDDPKDIKDKFYGNPDVKGPRSNHGTSVAGVIAANRNNNIGINGIASNVKIMCLRSTPAGDERDKDVALSIYYAVDNGANIINMSFGKEFSPQKKFVDDAVKFAEEKGVLIIHAAGNSGENIDVKENYPSSQFLDESEATNWISVGASSLKLDKKMAAVFSNYGQTRVDLFAPGVGIISTDSSSTYSMNDGTSLAAPVVSGVAALVLSYYPDLEPRELITILLSSSFKPSKPKKVLLPTVTNEKRKKVKFETLSKSGGIVNAYEALLAAEEKDK